jgi:Thioredoxin
MSATQEIADRSRVGVRVTLDVVATVAMTAASGFLIWSLWHPRPLTEGTTRPEVPVPSESISLDGAPKLGNPSARVVIVEFSDFECPYCGKFAREIMPELKSKYIDTSLVQFAFRHLPLTAIEGVSRSRSCQLCGISRQILADAR